MKKTKKKQKHRSSIFGERGEVGHFLGNHNTSVQKRKNPLRKYLNYKI